MPRVSFTVGKSYRAGVPVCSCTVGSHHHTLRVSKAARARHEIADRNLAATEAAVQRMFEVVQGQLKLSQIATLLQQGDLTGLDRYLDLENRLQAVVQGAGLQPEEDSFWEILARIRRQAAEAELVRLRNVPIAKTGVGVAMILDMESPESIAFLETYRMDLVREVSRKTRQAIQTVLLEAFRYGGHPYDQARTLRGMIGLTDTQVRAVENFRRALQGDPKAIRQALDRSLRDKRFDPTLWRAVRTGTGLTPARVNTMVERYYQRYLKYRSEMIARTETIRAGVQGTQETWRQAADQGYLDRDKTRQMWIVGFRGCETCVATRRMNAEGVPLGEMFATEYGPVTGPPLHPHCGCDVVLEFVN